MAKGLLIVNLGSPVSPETKDVRRYLREFLSDQNVITMPKALWQPILRGFIYPFAAGGRQLSISMSGPKLARH